MDSLYREHILDHYKNPRNHGRLKKPDFRVEDTNPLCGDRLTLELKCDKSGRITDIAFTAEGCAISVASASLLSEAIKGKKIDQIAKLGHEDVLELLGINIGAGRIKCALLPLAALHKAIARGPRKAII